MIESFWSRMQVELLDRQRWKTRVELANAIFEYLEIFHNRQRRHSALGMLTPIEFEGTNHSGMRIQSATPRNPGHSRASTSPGAVHMCIPPGHCCNAAAVSLRGIPSSLPSSWNGSRPCSPRGTCQRSRAGSLSRFTMACGCCTSR